MSNLYVRLHSSFWTHRKTLRLRRSLGDAAFWIPPRLWSFAAENAPNGDLSNYQAEDLAMLVQYSGDAQAMLEALHEAGFLENKVIKNWQERNAFHVVNHNRAKKAAEARWAKIQESSSEEEKERDSNKEKEKESKQAQSKHCLNDAPSIDAENLRIRIGSWFNRRATTTWSEKEMKALKAVLKLNTPSDDIDALENRYRSGDTFLRRDPVTLLNNWNAEIDRAKQPSNKSGQTHAISNDPIARRNALLGDDVAEQQAAAARRSRAIDEANLRRFEATGLTPFD